jgi:hypothetical protein
MVGTGPARLLSLQNIRTLVGGARDDENDPNHGLEKIDRNKMKLYSYFKPSLEAGTYSIYAEQNITINDQENKPKLTENGHPQTVRVWNRKVDPPPAHTTPSGTTKRPPLPEPQVFEVVAPQFNLEPKLINSYYPPDGHADEARILPHIVFNDPHLPWERGPGKQVFGLYDQDPLDSTKFRSMVPWLALIVFDPKELRLDTAEEAQLLRIPGLEDAKTVDMNKQQNANGTFSMSVGDYLTKVKSRIKYEIGYQKDTGEFTDLDGWTEIQKSPDAMKAIFPKKALFKKIFENPDFVPPPPPPAKGGSGTTATPATPATPATGNARSDNVEGHRYLAHVRHINTTGCPDAGIDQEGLFSVVLSGRTGAIGIQQPTPQVCHLVSIEHVDSTFEEVKKWLHDSPENESDRIGMVSLFSWIYMVS